MHDPTAPQVRHGNAEMTDEELDAAVAILAGWKWRTGEYVGEYVGKLKRTSPVIRRELLPPDWRSDDWKFLPDDPSVKMYRPTDLVLKYTRDLNAIDAAVREWCGQDERRKLRYSSALHNLIDDATESNCSDYDIFNASAHDRSLALLSAAASFRAGGGE